MSTKDLPLLPAPEDEQPRKLGKGEIVGSTLGDAVDKELKKVMLEVGRKLVEEFERGLFSSASQTETAQPDLPPITFITRTAAISTHPIRIIFNRKGG